MNVKYGVIIPARNEEAHIGRSILSLRRQVLRPLIIVVIDDSSNDKTALIAEKMGALVIKLKRKSSVSATGTPYLAYVINKGLEVVEKYSLDYVMISGADCLYPKGYAHNLISRMKKENVILASGVVVGEYTSPLSVRGSGRMINAKWFRSIGFRYPLNYGFETWLIFKALSQGFKVKVYKDLKFISLRKTSFNKKKAYLYGKAMRALGYTPLYTLIRATYLALKYGHSIARYLVLGYLKSKVGLYEDILQCTKYIQAKNLLYKLFREI